MGSEGLYCNLCAQDWGRLGGGSFSKHTWEWPQVPPLRCALLPTGTPPIFVPPPDLSPAGFVVGELTHQAAPRKPRLPPPPHPQRAEGKVVNLTLCFA